MCPFSYAVVSSSTSITRTSGSSSCPSSQSVETRTSGFAYSVMRMNLLAFDVGAMGGGWIPETCLDPSGSTTQTRRDLATDESTGTCSDHDPHLIVWVSAWLNLWCMCNC